MSLPCLDLKLLSLAEFKELSLGQFGFEPTSYDSAVLVEDELRRRKLGYVPYLVLYGAFFVERPQLLNPPKTLLTKAELRSLQWAVRKSVAWTADATATGSGPRLAAEQQVKAAKRAISKLKEINHG